eukprot:14623344-Alexandrium_andersonii.AAC.1
MSATRYHVLRMPHRQETHAAMLVSAAANDVIDRGERFTCTRATAWGEFQRAWSGEPHECKAWSESSAHCVGNRSARGDQWR